MTRVERRLLLALVVTVTGLLPAGGAAANVEIRETGAFAGYTLLVPQTTTDTHLLDLEGRVVHTWRSGSLPGLSAGLRDDGLLMRVGRVTPVPGSFAGAPGGQGGLVEVVDWDSTVVASFEYASDRFLQHHDAVTLPSGNVMFLAWQFKTAEEAIAMGRDPALVADGHLFPDSVIEVDVETGRIVWEWHVWDHLVQDFDRAMRNFGDPAGQPGKIDLNWVHDDGAASWNHLNGIAYDAERDHVVVSSRHFSELWVIDHRTSTKEARGKKGDLIGRFGNPEAYRMGTAEDRTLFFQHDPDVIAPGLRGAGRFLVFNNGDSEGRAYSTVDEIVPARKGRRFAMKDGVYRSKMERVVPHATAASQPFFAGFISGAQRLPNGNTLVTDGPIGRVFEVTRAGTRVWEYTNDHFTAGPTIVFQGFEIRPERLFKVDRFPASHPAFKDRKLPPAAPRKGEYSY
jgi:hypothetical protein